jgi:hypothetical protein
MTWRPERGWISLSARVGIAAGGVVVLAAGLATGPIPLVPASPKDSAVSRIESDQPRASRPLIRQEPTRVGERVAAAAGADVDASRVNGQISEGPVATTDRGGETANDVAPAPLSNGGAPQSGSNGSPGNGEPSEPHPGGSDDPAGSGSSGEGSDGVSDDNDPDPDREAPDGGDAPDDDGGDDSENTDDDDES